MVAARYAYSKGRLAMRGALAVFAVFFGALALLFAGPPQLWTSERSNQSLFNTNVAHADVPQDAGGSAAGACSDCSCDSGGGAGCGACGACCGACGDCS